MALSSEGKGIQNQILPTHLFPKSGAPLRLWRKVEVLFTSTRQSSLSLLRQTKLGPLLLSSQG